MMQHLRPLLGGVVRSAALVVRSAALLVTLVGLSFRADGATSMGVHVHELKPFRALGSSFSGIRLWDTRTTWKDLEVEQGQWDFRRLDGFVEAALRSGRKVLLTLGSTPAWASMRPEERCGYGSGCAAPPRKLIDWREYVRQVVMRYRGRIECYEIWNEVRFREEDPYDYGGPTDFYSGTSDELVELTREAFEVIKDIDPLACVLSPSFHVRADWIGNLDRFLSKGGKDFIDGVSFHFYSLTPEHSLRSLRAVRAVMDKHGIGDKPLWNTEFGYKFNELVSEEADIAAIRRMASLVSRSVILASSEKVARHYWYAFDNRNYGVYYAYIHRPALFESADRSAPLSDFLQLVDEINELLRTFSFSDCRPHRSPVWMCYLTDRRNGTSGVTVWSSEPDFKEGCIGKESLPESVRQVVDSRGKVLKMIPPEGICVGSSPMLLTE